MQEKCIKLDLHSVQDEAPNKLEGLNLDVYHLPSRRGVAGAPYRAFLISTR